MRPGWSRPRRAPHQWPLPQGHWNLEHGTLCSVRSTGCGHREKQCSQALTAPRCFQHQAGDNPVLWASPGPEQAPPAEAPPRIPSVTFWLMCLRPRCLIGQGEGLQVTPPDVPPAALGALLVLSERLSSLRRAETSAPCCSHRGVLLPPPHGPGGLNTNILMPKGEGEGQTPHRALTNAEPEFPVQRNHLSMSHTDPSASWRGKRLSIMHNSLGGKDICDQVMTMWVCVSGCSIASHSCDPIDCSPRGSSVHGIFQARILEWAAICFSRGSSPPQNRTCVY